jgi:hypothetical protein
MASKLVDLEKRRYGKMRDYAIRQALERLESERPGFTPHKVVALIAAYEEEGNIGPVLEKMPTSVDGEPYTMVVTTEHPKLSELSLTSL